MQLSKQKTGIFPIYGQTLTAERNLENKCRCEKNRKKEGLFFSSFCSLHQHVVHVLYAEGGHVAFRAPCICTDNTDATYGWMCVHAWNDSDWFRFRTVSDFSAAASRSPLTNLLLSPSEG